MYNMINIYYRIHQLESHSDYIVDKYKQPGVNMIFLGFLHIVITFPKDNKYLYEYNIFRIMLM